MYKYLLLFLGCLAAGTSFADDEVKVFSRAESFSYSGAVPAISYMNLIIGPGPAGGEHAFSRNRFEMGMRWDNFEMSFIHRNDYNLDFSADAAEFAWRNKNRKTIVLGEQYDVDVWANQYQVSGLRWAYTWQLPKNIKVTPAFSYLTATESIYGYLGKNENGEGGKVAIVKKVLGGQERNTLDGDLYTDYYYSKDPFFERDVRASDGRGYAVDLEASWQISPSWSVDLLMQDLMGEISWRDMPHTKAEATSDTVVVDDEGFLSAYPYFAGEEDFKNLKQPLVNRERLRTTYQWRKYRFGYELDHMKVKTFNRLVAGYLWHNTHGINYAYEIGTGASRLEWLYKAGKLSFSWDTLNFDNARTLGFSWEFYLSI